MVEQVAQLGVSANVSEVPGLASVTLVAQWAHWEFALALADLRRHGIRVHRHEAVDEDEHTDDRRRDEPTGIEAQPGEVESDFLTKILPDAVQGLIFWPSSPSSPVGVKDLPWIQRRWVAL